MKRGGVAFLSGLVFAIGLVLSGMTQPDKVLAFLDVAGAWDPSLAFVMMGAIAVSAIAFRVSSRMATPAFGARFFVPSRGRVRADVITGAAIFGIGWGLSGLCPGPAIVALSSGRLGAFVFVAAMVVGARVADVWGQRSVAVGTAAEETEGTVRRTNG